MRAQPVRRDVLDRPARADLGLRAIEGRCPVLASFLRAARMSPNLSAFAVGQCLEISARDIVTGLQRQRLRVLAYGVVECAEFVGAPGRVLLIVRRVLAGGRPVTIGERSECVTLLAGTSAERAAGFAMNAAIAYSGGEREAAWAGYPGASDLAVSANNSLGATDSTHMHERMLRRLARGVAEAVRLSAGAAVPEGFA